MMQVESMRLNNLKIYCQTEELRVRELYEHPWYEYKRQELVASGDHYGGPEGKQDVSI